MNDNHEKRIPKRQWTPPKRGRRKRGVNGTAINRYKTNEGPLDSAVSEGTNSERERCERLRERAQSSSERERQMRKVNLTSGQVWQLKGARKKTTINRTETQTTTAAGPPNRQVVK